LKVFLFVFSTLPFTKLYLKGLTVFEDLLRSPLTFWQRLSQIFSAELALTYKLVDSELS